MLILTISYYLHPYLAAQQLLKNTTVGCFLFFWPKRCIEKISIVFLFFLVLWRLFFWCIYFSYFSTSDVGGVAAEYFSSTTLFSLQFSVSHSHTESVLVAFYRYALYRVSQARQGATFAAHFSIFFFFFGMAPHEKKRFSFNFSLNKFAIPVLFFNSYFSLSYGQKDDCQRVMNWISFLLCLIFGTLGLSWNKVAAASMHLSLLPPPTY